jgi:hypothetical protein
MIMLQGRWGLSAHFSLAVQYLATGLAGDPKLMLSQPFNRITKRIRSSIIELSFHGILLFRPLSGEKV